MSAREADVPSTLLPTQRSAVISLPPNAQPAGRLSRTWKSRPTLPLHTAADPINPLSSPSGLRPPLSPSQRFTSEQMMHLLADDDFRLTPIPVELDPHPQLREMKQQIDDAIDSFTRTAALMNSRRMRHDPGKRFAPFLHTASIEEWHLAVDYVNRRLAAQEWTLHRTARRVVALGLKSKIMRRQTAQIATLLDTVFSEYPQLNGGPPLDLFDHRPPLSLFNHESGWDAVTPQCMSRIIVESLNLIRKKAGWENRCYYLLSRLQLSREDVAPDEADSSGQGSRD